VEDLEGIKLRVMQNNVFLQQLQDAGCQRRAHGLLTSFFSALETNTVDGQENPYNTTLVQQVLRGAEVRDRDQPRLQPLDRAGEQKVVGSAVQG